MGTTSVRRYNIDDQDYRANEGAEMARSQSLCFRINTTDPTSSQAYQLVRELVSTIADSARVISPLQIDMGARVSIGEDVVINHSITMMALGGITIDERAMCGPHVSLLTVNHDFDDHRILLTKPIHIKRNAWIGANASILAGVTVGENSVVAAGAVVSRDVPDNTIVGGCPARVIKKIAV